MSSIYQKTVSDKTNILAPREYFIRPFDFQNWTEARFGILWSAVASSGDNVTVAPETVALSTAADLISFGLKDSATSALPGQAGSIFLGATNALGASALTFGAGAAGANFASNLGNPAVLAATGYNGVTKFGGTGSEGIDGIQCPSNTAVASGYCGFYALKFVINNRGLSTQTVTITGSTQSTVSGTDYSASALRILLNNATYTNGGTIAWNTGAAARDIPDSFWIRAPFYSNRMRISCMMGVRYLP